MSLGKTLWILIRALVYATFFISVLFVFVPFRLLEFAGVTAPAQTNLQQVLGIIFTAVGLALGLWSILTFVFVGKGTQAPFDPPHALVVRGPYRPLRNPMYAAATLALVGVALYFESAVVLGYAAVFWIMTHLFVVFVEEPFLRKSFGDIYKSYCHRTGRWWPRT